MLCTLLSNINWLWFAVAVFVTFAIGALWYSVLFPKTWMRVFRLEMPEKTTGGLIIRTLLLQFIVNILFGLLFFILVKLSVGPAIFALIAFCAWEKGILNFQFSKFKDYCIAAGIQVGYTCIAGIVYILFALI